MITVFTKNDELFKARFNIDSGSLDITPIAESGLSKGSYEESVWMYRFGYFYSLIDNKFHYKNEAGLVMQADDLVWNGSPWINESGELVGISDQELIIYDLEDEVIVNAYSVSIDETIRNVLQIQGTYFVVTMEYIYNLDIGSGMTTEFSKVDFTPSLTSPQRSIGRLYDSFNNT